MRRSRVVVAVVLAVLLLTAGLAFAVSARAADGLVHPERKVGATPADQGLAYERVTFPATDGTPLVAWWIPAEGADATTPAVVFFHGYGEGKHQGLEVARTLHAHGFSVLLPDFRAHGESGGDFTTVGLLETRDVAGAVEWLKARLACDGPSRIALVGWSMGGASVLNAAPDLDVAAVVTDSTFADLQSMVASAIERYTGLPAFPFAPMTVYAGERETGVRIAENRPAESAARVKVPLLVVHGLADDVADAGSARRIGAANPDAEVFLVAGAGHVSSWDVAPAYQKELLRFLDAAFERLPAAERPAAQEA